MMARRYFVVAMLCVLFAGILIAAVACAGPGNWPLVIYDALQFTLALAFVSLAMALLHTIRAVIRAQ